MAKLDDIKTLIGQLNTATNEIASDLQALRDRINGGLSPAEADAVIADLNPIVARLTALGQDPADPVPTP